MTAELIGIIAVGLALAALMIVLIIRIETRPENRTERPSITEVAQEQRERLAKLEGEVAILRDYIVSLEGERPRV